MSISTEEEIELARDIGKNARAIVAYAFNNDDVRLRNLLDGMIEFATASRYRKKADAPRRRAVRGYELRTSQREDVKHHLGLLAERLGETEITRVISALQSQSSDQIREKLASGILRLYDDRGDYVSYVINVVKQLYRRVVSQSQLGEVKLRIIKEDDNEPSKTEAPFKDKGAGEILYHLDMAARHIDVLVDYVAVAGHESELLGLSTNIQQLAQKVRSELESMRTPLDKEDVEVKNLNR